MPRGLFPTLATRLRWSYALVSVIPLTLLGLALIGFGLRAQRQRIAQEQQTTANWVAREIWTAVSSVDEQLLKLGRQAGPDQPTAEILQAIATLRETMPEIVDVAVLDRRGRERVHVSQLRGFHDSELIDRSPDPLVEWTLSTGRTAQGPIANQGGGIRIYPSYAPIFTDSGQIDGVIRVEVRIDRIARTLNEAPLAAGSRAYIVDRSGRLLFAADSSLVPEAPAVLASFLGDRDASREYTSAGQTDVVGAWSRVPVQPARWWVVVELPQAIGYAPVRRDTLILLGVVALVILTTLGWGRYQTRQVLRPIDDLRAGARTIGTGDLAARIAIHSDDEIGALAEEFNRMAGHLQASQAAIEQQNQRLRDGLALAHDIQMGLLPSAPPVEIPCLALRGHSVPAYEVGGDFYTYIPIDEHRMAVVIGDVSGKGVGAALMMALVSSMVEAQGRIIDEPVQLVCSLNQELNGRMTANRMNAAVLYTIIDMDRATFHVANAGMIPPFLLRGGDATMIKAHGMPIGMMADFPYSEIQVELQPGDLILLVSDGVVEARRADGDLFGFRRLEALLSEHDPAAPPEDLIAMIIDRVTQFVDGEEQNDDITIVVIRPELATVAHGAEHLEAQAAA